MIATEKELGEIDLTTLSVTKTQKEDGSFIESEINFAIWAFSIREKSARKLEREIKKSLTEWGGKIRKLQVEEI